MTLAAPSDGEEERSFEALSDEIPVRWGFKSALKGVGVSKPWYLAVVFQPYPAPPPILSAGKLPSPCA